ncbi:hypothetical protein [Streptomyces sp. CB03238]|uniref:hypothetical protein n=1 Tax=Streptomyces sp. CB03238 TaxID=1907777 RepID=UPI000A0F57F6|nr:hypothetical protein [Streptomyces sp. CB03238]ORT58934.1 hypothetical protein BKD26_17395 [Streptomyces sp. CB03238]
MKALETIHAYFQRPGLAGIDGDGEGDGGRDRTAWRPAATAAVVALVTYPLCLLIVGLATMSTDSCGPRDCGPGTRGPLAVMYVAYQALPYVTLAALAVATALPWHQRWRPARRWAARAALLPQATILTALVVLLAFGG